MDTLIKDTAIALTTRYGIATRVAFDGESHLFEITGGNPLTEYRNTPTGYVLASGVTLDGATRLYEGARHHLANLDPHQKLRDQAAAAGFTLVPNPQPSEA